MCGVLGHQVESCPMAVSALDRHQIPEPPEMGRPKAYDQILLRGWSPASEACGDNAGVSDRDKVYLKSLGMSRSASQPSQRVSVEDPASLGEGGTIILEGDACSVSEDGMDGLSPGTRPSTSCRSVSYSVMVLAYSPEIIAYALHFLTLQVFKASRTD